MQLKREREAPHHDSHKGFHFYFPRWMSVSGCRCHVSMVLVVILRDSPSAIAQADEKQNRTEPSPQHSCCPAHPKSAGCSLNSERKVFCTLKEAISQVV